MLWSKVVQLRALVCFDNDLENNTWNLEHNSETIEKILNGIMQGYYYLSPSIRPPHRHLDAICTGESLGNHREEHNMSNS